MNANGQPQFVTSPTPTATSSGFTDPMSATFPVSVDYTTGPTPNLPPTGQNVGWQGKARRWIPDPDDPTLARSRTLVLCFDGTGDQFDNDNSNIVQLMALLKKDDPTKQQVYYQAGVGTYKGSSISTPGTFSKILDLMIANTLGEHVRDGYEFLMEHYIAGDKICIFGFSRGAYTARALAGMVQKVGLLPPGNKQQIPFAYHMYSQEDSNSLALCRDFKRTYGIDVKIEFCGVWDTVASVGIIPRYLPFVSTNNSIRFFRHAVSLDEHRAKFMPNFYKDSGDLKEGEDNCDDEHHDDSEADGKDGKRSWTMGDLPKTITKSQAHPVRREHSAAWLLEYDLNAESGQKTDSLEVFFAGCHCDIGGGSVQNHIRHSLARIPLRWMIRECFKTRTGLIFDMDMLNKEVGMDIDLEHRRILAPPTRMQADNAEFCIRQAATKAYRGPAPNRNVTRHRWFRPKYEIPVSHTPEISTAPAGSPLQGEAYEEMMDALSPMYDQLSLAPFWWILEWAPLRQLKQRAIYNLTSNESDFVWMVNNGQGRKVFKHVVHRGLKVHRSVLTRLEAVDHMGKSESYVPLIRPNIHAVGEGGGSARVHFRRMSHKEWLKREAPGLDKEWFEWVD